jgi:hypothetical protein
MQRWVVLPVWEVAGCEAKTSLADDKYRLYDQEEALIPWLWLSLLV